MTTIILYFLQLIILVILGMRSSAHLVTVRMDAILFTPYFSEQFTLLVFKNFIYCTRAILTRGLYIYYPIFKTISLFSRSFFQKIMFLSMVSIQERFIIKDGL